MLPRFPLSPTPGSSHQRAELALRPPAGSPGTDLGVKVGPWLGCQGSYPPTLAAIVAGDMRGRGASSPLGPGVPPPAGPGSVSLSSSTRSFFRCRVVPEGCSWAPALDQSCRTWQRGQAGGGGSLGPAVHGQRASHCSGTSGFPGLCGALGSQSWPRTEYGGHCVSLVPPGIGVGGNVPGGKDVCVYVEWLQRCPGGLFFWGTGSVCTPSGWTWALPATCSG